MVASPRDLSRSSGAFLLPVVLLAYVLFWTLLAGVASGTAWVAPALAYADWPLDVGVVAIAFAVARSRLHDRRVRQAWACIGAAFACLVATEVLPALYGRSRAITALYLLVHPLLLVAWFRLQRVFESRQEMAGFVLDALIVLLGATMVLWVLFLEPVFAGESAPDSSRMTIAFTYAAGDLVLLFGLAMIAVRRPDAASGVVYRWLAVALAFGLVGDHLWVRDLALGEGPAGPASRLFWMIGSAALIMAAATQLRVPRLALEAPDATRAFSAVPYAAALLGVGILLLAAVFGDGGVSTPVMVLTTLLFCAVLGRLALSQRISVETARERARRESDVQRDALLQHSADGIVVLDGEYRLQYFNPGFEEMLDRPCAIGDPLETFVVESDRQRLANILRASEGPGPHRARLRLERSPEARVVEAAISDFGPDYRDLIVNLRDVSEQVALEEQLSQRMLRDPLTGLPNRALFNDRVAQALAGGADVGHSVAVLLADLDRFKSINDTRGHAIGDQLLVAAARRLRDVVPATATVARAADDEFAILLAGELSIEDVTRTADAARKAFETPFELGQDPIVITASVGIAGPAKKDSAEELIRKADVAMTQAKAGGRNQVTAFEPRIDQALGSRAALLAGLREAVRLRRIDVAFQPIYDITTNRLFGLEALARWVDPEQGRIAPGVFIAIAEDGGLMQELGALIFDRALEHAAGIDRDFVLSINISARQLEDHGFSGLILNALEASRWPAERLLLEMTESVIAEDRRVVRHNLAYLREAGVRIAIDDFGTGYSSLSQLHEFPVDVLKIDRRFIQQIGTDSGAETVRAVIAIGRALGLEIIAEGVEDEDQLAVLRELDCQYIQGFLFGQPLFARDLKRLSTRVG